MFEVLVTFANLFVREPPFQIFLGVPQFLRKFLQRPSMAMLALSAGWDMALMRTLDSAPYPRSEQPVVMPIR